MFTSYLDALLAALTLNHLIPQVSLVATASIISISLSGSAPRDDITHKKHVEKVLFNKTFSFKINHLKGYIVCCDLNGDGAAPPLHLPQHGRQQRRLAGANMADYGHQGTRFHLHADPLQTRQSLICPGESPTLDHHTDCI